MNDQELKMFINKPKRTPGEFRVGDIVTCYKKGMYARTSVGIRCQVVAVPKHGYIRVEILEGRHRGETHGVDTEHFELLEESQA